MAECTQTGIVALWTVPVVLKNGHRKIKVNAPTKTYINADIEAKLDLQGKPHKVTVNILNGQIETFKTMPVAFELKSLDATVKKTVTAFTAEKDTGNMEAINWGKYAAK